MYKNKLKTVNVKLGTIKYLEESISRTLFFFLEHSDINHSNIFLNPSPSVMGIKTEINKWDLIKHKFLHSKRSHKQKTDRIGENFC